MFARRLLLLLLAARMVFGLAILVAAAGTANAQTNDNLIVPGERMGHFRIGMTPAELFRSAGDATRVDGPPPGGTNHGTNYFFQNVTVHVAPDTGVVNSVNTTDKNYATAEGVHVGSSALAVTANYGNPNGTSPPDYDVAHYCYDQGLMFQLDKGGSVIQVSVFQPSRNYCQEW